MVVLLTGDDVDHLVKLELLVTLGRSSNIARDVDVGTILLAHDRLAELVLLKVDNEGSLALLDDPSRLKHLEGLGLRRVRDLRLARVEVKVDVEARVGLAVLGDGEVAELAPEIEGFGVAWLRESLARAKGRGRGADAPDSMPTKNSRARSCTVGSVSPSALILT